MLGFVHIERLHLRRRKQMHAIISYDGIHIKWRQTSKENNRKRNRSMWMTPLEATLHKHLWK